MFERISRLYSKTIEYSNYYRNTLLESLPAVNILAYSLETVIAEKFHAVVDLADQSSRMKDYYDLYHLLSKEKIVISPFYGEATYFLYLWNMANH